MTGPGAVTFSDRYSPVDRLLHRLSFATAGLQADLADLEELIYRRRLAGVSASRPVFLAALPRAGTTLVLEFLAALDGFASHSYRDMPFVELPLLWHGLSRWFHQSAVERERAHGDGIMIGLDSPEAFEEMLWHARYPGQYRDDRIVPWTDCGDAELVRALTGHMRKVIALRGPATGATARYLSKNNGNIARLECLRRGWPDATIIVAVREPVQHAASLLRQHTRFLELHAADGFAREYMKGVCHFDFGDNLRPIDFGGWLATAVHRDARTLGFWLEYWVAAYEHLLAHGQAQAQLLSFDAFCASPSRGLGWLADVLALDAGDRARLEARRADVRLPPAHAADLTAVAPAVVTRAAAIYQALLAQIARARP
jgi:hypothetical protein